MAGADALRHVPVVVRRPGRAAPLAAAACRATGADAEGAHARRGAPASLLKLKAGCTQRQRFLPAILIMTEFSLLREVSRTPERFRRGEATQSHRKAI